MPPIKTRANRVGIVRHICRLQEPQRDALVLYARFIGNTTNYVLKQLIETTIAKDREVCGLPLNTKRVTSGARRARWNQRLAREEPSTRLSTDADPA